MEKLETYVPQWSSNFAYAIGLIASDGYLAKDTYRIGLVSKDSELIEHFRTCFSLTNKVSWRARGGNPPTKYQYLEFKRKSLYEFLNSIGITATKSRTIQSVEVPDEFFADFLRGLIDGDGTFWSHWDKRWPNSFVYHLEIASASPVLISWLKQRLTKLYGVKGVICQGKGVQSIRYVKGDSRKLVEKMYYQNDLLYLRRKYEKIMAALDFDLQLKQSVHTPR